MTQCFGIFGIASVRNLDAEIHPLHRLGFSPAIEINLELVMVSY